MDRRSFFKNMFGAAVVAAMPKIVVDQIEKIPIEEITPQVITPQAPKVIPNLGDRCLYLYDNDKLIAGSTQFNLEFHREFYHEFLDHTALHIKGPYEWKVSVEKLRWFDYKVGMNYFEENIPLHCVIHYDKNLVVSGDTYLTECRLTAPMDAEIQEDIVLTGTGELLLTIPLDDKNSIAKKSLGATKGTKKSTASVSHFSQRRISRK